MAAESVLWVLLLPPISGPSPLRSPTHIPIRWMLQEELRAAVQQQQRPPPVLKFRPSGAKEWLHPCVLLPGLHLAGGGSGGGGKGGSTAALAEVHISRCCATTRILLLPEASEVGGDCAAAAAAAATTAEQPRPLWIELRCGQLQVCLWDDERQRLLPAAVAGGGPTLGRELFSLSIDRLHLQLSRQVLLEPAAAAAAALQRGDSRRLHPWQQQALVVTSARLTATALQLDSFLPGSEQPVLLTSLPEGSIAATSLGSLPQRHGPPLQLALEIHHCPPLPALAVAGGGGSCPEEGSQGGSGMSFRNAWVHDMLIQLPTLAAAADDALLLFGERLSSLLAGSGGGDDNSSINGGEGIPVASSGAAGEGSAPPLGAVAGSSGTQQPPALATLQQSLATEAAGAAASRLYIEQAVVESGKHGSDACSAACRRWCQTPVYLPPAFLNPLLFLSMSACSAPPARRAHCGGHSWCAGGGRHPPGSRHPLSYRCPRRPVQVRLGCQGCETGVAQEWRVHELFNVALLWGQWRAILLKHSFPRGCCCPCITTACPVLP